MKFYDFLSETDKPSTNENKVSVQAGNMSFSNDDDVYVPNYPEVVLVSDMGKKRFTMIYKKGNKFIVWDGEEKNKPTEFNKLDDVVKYLNKNGFISFQGYNRM